MNITFIGLGLIGGSIAKSIRRFHPDHRLAACSPDPSSLSYAVQNGIIDRIYQTEDPAMAESDLIFLCAPVEDNIRWLSFLKETVRPDCLISDVGSVKTPMMEAVDKAGLSRQFIGGHPMAGSEKTGVENSTDFLLENTWYFLIPGQGLAPSDLDRFAGLIRSIRSLPMILAADEHDRVVASVSHLPHLIASSLVNLVGSLDTPDEKMRQVAAGGFRDITRIASASPDIWEQICMSNREAILPVLRHYIEDLISLENTLKEADRRTIHRLFSDSRDYRDSLNDNLKGSVARQYALYVDIYDEPGGIATITTLLAMRQISISNISILHNREFEEGVLRIEFYDEAARTEAEGILINRNYHVRKTT